MAKAQDIKDQIRTKRKKSKAVSPTDMLSSGSTLINLACTGTPHGGFAKGKYFFLVGDSSSGKTFLSLTCLAEAGINKHFKDYRFIYDNNEDGALMDMARFFGAAVAERMEAPAQNDDGTDAYSESIEDFYDNLDDAFDGEQPFIYILDSQDSLTSESEEEKAAIQKKARAEGKDAAGSYGDGKAKKHSENMRRVMPKLRASKSILIVINQTRDNIGFGFEKKTRSGGRALKFYATLELWSSVKKRIKKTVKGKPRQIGILAQVQIKKNRFTGRERTVEVPIYHSFGFDDVGSCVDYLLEEKHWKNGKGGILAPEFDYVGNRAGLIRFIEDNDLEHDMREIVAEVWDAIEAACAVKRKARY